MVGLPSKNTTWNLTVLKNEKWGTSRYSITSCRLGAWPRISNRTDPPPPGKRSSQNGATIELAADDGSDWLSKPKKPDCESKLRTPLLPMRSDVRPGEAPPNGIG